MFLKKFNYIKYVHNSRWMISIIFRNIKIYFPSGHNVQVDLENMNCFWRNYNVHVDHNTNPFSFYRSYSTEIYYNYTSGVIIDVSPPLEKKNVIDWGVKVWERSENNIIIRFRKTFEKKINNTVFRLRRFLLVVVYQ